MMIKLAFFLSLATHIHADIVTYFDALEMVNNITATKLSCSDMESLGGDVVKHTIMPHLAPYLIHKGVLVIGREELRAALNFGPVPPIALYNETKPSEEELASAPTLEAYYDLRESRSNGDDTLLNHYLLDKNIPPAVAFLDKKYPSIRALFKRKIQDILQTEGGIMSRESIDLWISELRQLILIQPILAAYTPKC